jgi:transposase InsO family protein
MRHLYKVAHAPESAHAVELVSVMELHRRMGHIAVASARKLVESGAITGVELDPNSQEHDCDACIFARATCLPVPKVRISTPAQRFGDEIHTDVWGPASISTRQGRRYFVTFTDDATRFTITYLMRTKDQALEAYKSFEAWALTQGHCRAIKVLRSDRGGEYLSDAFNAHLAAAGTARKLTVHDTPQLNGVAERLNRTLLERIRAFAHGSGLPKSFWGEALRHAVWLKNRTATRALDGRTPFEALYGRPPDLSRLRVWGCHVWVHDPDRSKLDVRAREARWLSFDVDARAHRVFWPGPGNVTVERNVYFATSALSEGEGTLIPASGGEQTDAPPAPTTSSTPESPAPSSPPAPVSTPPAPVLPPVPEPPQLRRSARTRKPSHLVRDLQSGEGVGMQLPRSFAEESEEAGGAWSVEDGTPVLLEDFEGFEFVFVTETADAEAFEPRTLAEAKRSPDWNIGKRPSRRSWTP